MAQHARAKLRSVYVCRNGVCCACAWMRASMHVYTYRHSQLAHRLAVAVKPHTICGFLSPAADGLTSSVGSRPLPAVDVYTVLTAAY